MPISDLRYPNKSHRKIISIPKESEELAELIGIIFGDGGYSNPWQIVISLNSILDQQYSLYIKDLVKRLFDLDVAIRKRPNMNNLVVVLTSTTLVDFLVSKGVIRGNKILNNMNIPLWIKNNLNYQRNFVRGLVDTDGCLYIHRHKVSGHLYRNLGFCFTSYARGLTKSVGKIFIKNGFSPYFRSDYRQIYLYSHQAVLKYLKIFGTSNPRILNKYLEWRGVGVVDRAGLESL